MNREVNLNTLDVIREYLSCGIHDMYVLSTRVVFSVRCSLCSLRSYSFSHFTEEKIENGSRSQRRAFPRIYPDKVFLKVKVYV